MHFGFISFLVAGIAITIEALGHQSFGNTFREMIALELTSLPGGLTLISFMAPARPYFLDSSAMYLEIF